MSRPTEVIINGYPWTIEWLKPKQWAKEDEGLSGVTYSAFLCIKVLLIKDMNPICEREVFLHELL